MNSFSCSAGYRRSLGLLLMLFLGLGSLPAQTGLGAIRIGKGRFDRPIFTDTHGYPLSPKQIGGMINASGDPEAISLYRSWKSIHTLSGLLIYPAVGTLAYGTASFIFPGLERSLPALLAGIAGSMISGGIRFEFQERLVAAAERYNEILAAPAD